jgi:hypothetical protein
MYGGAVSRLLLDRDGDAKVDARDPRSRWVDPAAVWSVSNHRFAD